MKKNEKFLGKDVEGIEGHREGTGEPARGAATPGGADEQLLEKMQRVAEERADKDPETAKTGSGGR